MDIQSILVCAVLFLAGLLVQRYSGLAIPAWLSLRLEASLANPILLHSPTQPKPEQTTPPRKKLSPRAKQPAKPSCVKDLFLNYAIRSFGQATTLIPEQTIHISSSCTVAEVKKVIKAKHPFLNVGFTLAWHDLQLDEVCHLRNYGVNEDSMLYVIPRRSLIVPLRICMSENMILHVDANPTDSVRDLIQELQLRVSSQATRPKLRVCLRNLGEHETVQSLNLHSYTDLKYVTQLQIFIMMSGKSFALDVEETYIVSEVKARFQKITGVPTDYQSLKYAGKILEDHKSLKAYNITHGGTLFMAVKNSPHVSFTVSYGSRSITVQMKWHETVKDLKLQLLNMNILRDRSSSIYYQDEKLSDSATIADCKINPCSVVTVRSENSMEPF